MRNRFVHICEEFEHIWLGKDNGLLPVYMAKDEDWESEIWTFDLKKDLPDEIRGVSIVKLKEVCPWLRNFAAWTKFVKRLHLYKHLIKESKNIDVLMLFHMTKSSYWNAYFYKKFNPKGKVYVKGDFNLDIYKREMEIVEGTPKDIKGFFRRCRYRSEYKKRKKLADLLDILSYESEKSYEAMKEDYAGISTKGKTLYLPNGTDDFEVDSCIEKKCINKKENIILVVGRLGEYAKNTEGILEALDEMDMKDWKVLLIGRISNGFQWKIEEFYRRNPDKKETVIFKGPVYDRKELAEYYNRSKVFLMPSRWESFGIAMIEAITFGNYLITTPTSAVEDITNGGRFGKIVKDNIELKKALEDVFEGRVNLKKEYLEALKHSEKFRWSKLIEKLKEKF